jgi:hypothetical protein
MQDSRYKNNSTPIKYKIAEEEEIEIWLSKKHTYEIGTSVD